MNKINFLRKKDSKISLITFIVVIFSVYCNQNFIFSQITINDPEQVVEKEYTAPLIPDTTKPISYHEHKPDYKQYIGLEIYLPPDYEPSNNGYVERQKLFNTSLTKVDIDKNEPIVFKKYRHVSKKSSEVVEVTDSIEYTKILTYTYRPIYKETEYRFYDYNRQKNPHSVKFDQDIFDKYYTIIDVLYGQRLRDTIDKLNNELQEAKTNLRDLQRKPQEANSENSFYIDDKRPFFGAEILFVLKDEDGKFLYSTSIRNDFISVSYFNTQVSLFKNANLIYDREDYKRAYFRTGIYEFEENDNGDKVKKEKQIEIRGKEIWKCEDVTLLKPNYRIGYILKKDGKQVIINEDDVNGKGYYVTFKLLSKYKEEERLSKQAKNLEQEEKRKEIEKKKIEEKRFLSYAISKYGSDKGNLIGKHKVKIGMNQEMCTDAWGKPFYINSTQTSGNEIEIWHYGYGTNLYFKNGKLEMINEIK